MTDIIKLLPDSIANQIAAGEVVQRPAAAVKELLENSLDSGATNIQLIIKDGGKTLMQVIDNGCGMSGTDARMSFERHATSKISAIEDLFAIRTMGFRGEALASIAAVAQVEMKTKQHDDELGTEINIEGTQVMKHEPVSCANGTSIAVKNLFFNVPARRNFLKTHTVETRHIIDEFMRIALANPEISFSLHNNGLEVFHLKAGNLKQRVVSLMGNNYNEKLVPVEEHTSVVNIYGFIGKPESAKKTRGEQYFFVNKRFIRNNYLNHAVVGAFKELLPGDSFPLYVLFLDIEPQRIDINVHPSKQEIKFDDEKIVYAFIHSSVKRALAQYSLTPSLDFERDNFDSQKSFSRNPFANSTVVQPEISTDKRRTNFHVSPSPHQNEMQKHEWKQLYNSTIEKPAATFTIPGKWEKEKQPNEKLIEDFSEKEVLHFQLHEQYVVTQIKSGFIIVDQQAAHERILFEKYLRGLNENKLTSQQSLFPQTINVSQSDFELMKELLPDIQALGFDMQEFGGNSFVVHGIPSDMKPGNETQVIENLIEGFKQNQTSVKLDKRESLARSMAKNNSIKRGEKLTEKEMKNLIDQLFACETPYHAPDGKATMMTFNLKELEKQFEKKS